MMISLGVATTALLVASVLVTACLVSDVRRASSWMWSKEKIASYEPEDFVISLGGLEPEDPVDGPEIRFALFEIIPPLEGQGVAIAVINIDACRINPPHTYPSAAEIIYMVEGDLRVCFTEENGGNRAIINDLSAGDEHFSPKGHIHYQQNLGCSPATLIAALNSEDPGIDTITRSFFNLPTEAIKVVLPVDEIDLEDILADLPTIAATNRQECLEECGLTAGGDGVCSNGLHGVQLGDICCSLSCGTCGGLGCAGRDGGRDECCSGAITNEGVRCSDSGVVPCIVDDD